MEEIQELRRWSAEDLLGFIETTPPKSKRTGYVLAKQINREVYLSAFYKDEWAPDSPDSPASQILMVVEKFLEMGGEIIIKPRKAPTRHYVQSFYHGVWHERFGPELNETILRAIKKAVGNAKSAWEAGR